MAGTEYVSCTWLGGAPPALGIVRSTTLLGSARSLSGHSEAALSGVGTPPMSSESPPPSQKTYPSRLAVGCPPACSSTSLQPTYIQPGDASPTPRTSRCEQLGST